MIEHPRPRRSPLVAGLLATLLVVGLAAPAAVLAATPTTTTLEITPSSVVYGDSVTFTATVEVDPGGSPVTTGTVTFADGSTTFGSAEVDGAGVARVTTVAPAGAYTNVIASYADSGSTYDPSSSPPATLSVTKATPTITWADPDPITHGTALSATQLNATASVTGSFVYDPPAGTVLPAGPHALSVTFTPDDTTNYTTATKDVSMTVGQTTSTTTVTSDHNPSLFGQSVIFTATVSGAGVTPTGPVTFKDGATTLGTGALVAGQATYATAALSVATHSITVVYAGDTNYTTSTSGALSQVVGKADSLTAVTGTTPSTTVIGQSYSVAVTVTAVSPGAGTPSGTVAISDGTGATCTIPALSGGAASCSLSSTTAGTKTITASYGGDVSFNGDAGTATHVVSAASTTTTVSSSQNPSSFGEGVTFSAHITTASGPTPVGTVQFKVDGFDLGTPVAVDGSGDASSEETTSLAVGDHSIVAVFTDASDFDTSTSDPLTQTVGQGDQTIAFTSTAPTGATVGGPTYTPTASATSGLAVTFTIDASASAVCTFAAGVVSFTAAGTCVIDANQTGDANWNAAPQVQQSFAVGKGATTTTVTSDHNPSVYGQIVTFTATMSAAPPGAGTPSGTVQFRVDGFDAGAPVALAGGQAALATTTLVVGSHEVTAVYAGDGSFNGSLTMLVGGQAVTKATVTVTADDATREYGQANPTLTATITGFVNGETRATSGVTGSPDCSSTATEASPVLGGPYAITCAQGTLAAANYDFAFADGALTITRVLTGVTVASDANPALPTQGITLTAAVTGIVAQQGNVQFETSPDGLGSWTAFGIQIPVTGTGPATATTTDTMPPTEGSLFYRAVYRSSDPNYADATSPVFDQVVGKSDTTIVVAASRPVWESTVPLTFRATIVPAASGATIPITGTVTFTEGSTPLGSASPNASGVATLVPDLTLALGPHTITATYDGDVTYRGNTGSITQTVQVNVVDATGVGVSGSTIYPYRDTWRDTVAIRGTRNEPLSVTIRIYTPAGKLLSTRRVAAGTGAYSSTWTGRKSSGAILPAGRYRVVQTLTDPSSAPALTRSWSSFVRLSTKRMYWKTVSLYKNANAPSIWSGPPSLLSSTRYSNGARLITPTSVQGWAAFGYSFTLPSATTVTKVAFYVKGGPWSGAYAPQIGLNDWRSSASYTYVDGNGNTVTCSSTSWCQAYSPYRVRRAVGTSTTSWYGISGDLAAVVRTVSGKRYVRGFVDTGGWVTGFRYDFARVRIVVTYGVLK